MNLGFPSWLRAERIIPLLCIAAATCLIASEFMTAFELTPPGGEALDLQTNADRHNYGLMVLAILAIVATLVAVWTGSRPASLAVAAVGGVVLLWFLILDLPDANSIGAIRDAVNVLPDAKAEPQGGFWLEAIGAVFLGLGGAGMATLTPEQLRMGGPVTGEGDEGSASDTGRSADGEEIYQR